MKCIVLAAGYATRLYPLTENFPKPLLEVKGKSSLSNIKEADIHDIAEIFVDKRFAGKSVEEMEEAEQVTIFLILREDLSILPQKDTILKLNDIIVIRGENP